jgi:serine protein kinase
MSIFGNYQSRYEDTQQEEYTLEEYLDICKNDPSAYATAAERLLLAIGEPELVDTAKDPRLSRIYSNKVIKRYSEFSNFYGMEVCIEQIVSFLRHDAQGLDVK